MKFKNLKRYWLGLKKIQRFAIISIFFFLSSIVWIQFNGGFILSKEENYPPLESFANKIIEEKNVMQEKNEYIREYTIKFEKNGDITGNLVGKNLELINFRLSSDYKVKSFEITNSDYNALNIVLVVLFILSILLTTLLNIVYVFCKYIYKKLTL